MTGGASHAASGAESRASRGSLVAASVTVSIAVFALYQAMALYRSGGAFFYPLDDVYIHLAMSAEILRGGYGVNPGEFAPAASSILYPVLLTPFAGTPAHEYVPLAWNTIAVAGSGALWGLILAEAGTLPRKFAMTLAVLGPLGVNIAGVAFTGMENAMHGTVSLMLVLGLVRYLRTGRPDWLLVAGIVLGPALRFEGMALSLAAAGVLLLTGRALLATLLGTAALLPPAGFALFLQANGAGLLPYSVQAKIGDAVGKDGSLPEKLLTSIVENISEIAGAVLLAMLVLLAVLTLRAAGSRLRLAGLAVVLAGTAHLVAGQIGWMDRYEHYILAATSATAAVMIGVAGGGQVARGVLLALLGVTAVTYQNNLTGRGQWAPAAFGNQTVQMARFAIDHAKGPVAVNDIGYMVYHNPAYVLDMWGLASRTALDMRLDPDPPDGWADPLAEREGVDLAMIYDRWLANAVGEDWVRLGRLDLVGPGGQLGDRQVSFYATSPASAPRLRSQLEEFVPTLPAGAAFTFDRPKEGQQDG